MYLFYHEWTWVHGLLFESHYSDLPEVAEKKRLGLGFRTSHKRGDL